MASNRILYSYMQDPTDDKRVVTIGRQLVNDSEGKLVIKFAFAVNNPGMRFYDTFTGKPFHDGPRDVFTKAKARMVVNARLEKAEKHFVVEFQADQHPMDTIRTFIALNRQDFPRPVVRTSEFASELREIELRARELVAQAQADSGLVEEGEV